MSAKIGGGFAVVLVLLVVVATLGLLAVREAVGSFTRVLEADVQAGVDAQRLELLTEQAAEAILEYFLPREVVQDIRVQWEDLFAALSARVHDEAGQQLLSQLYQTQQAFFGLSNEDFAAFTHQNELRALADEAGDLAAPLAAHVDALLEQARQDAVQFSRHAETRIMGAAAVALAVCYVFYYYLSRAAKES